MSWAKPSTAEAGWRDDAENSRGFTLVTAEQLGVESLGAMVVNARSRAYDHTAQAPKWTHTTRLPVRSLAVPASAVLAEADEDLDNFGSMKYQIERHGRPVTLACGGDEESILDALISREQRGEARDLDYFIRLAGALSTWLAGPPLARRSVLSHPSIEGRMRYVASNFLPLVRLIKLIEHSADDPEVEKPPIVVRASKSRPIGSLEIKKMRGAYRQGRSGTWGNIEAHEIKVPLAELHIPDDAALQEFRSLFAKRGCSDEELLAFIMATAQPIEALGGNSLVNLTEWSQLDESIKPTLADAARASIIQFYLNMTPANRALQFGPTGRVNYYGMRMTVGYQPPLKIEPFLNRMAATLGVKRKPSKKK